MATIADIWDGRASLSVEPQGYGQSFGMQFLSARWWRQGTLYAYYIRAAPRAGHVDLGVGLACSHDGTVFTDQGLVLPPGGEGRFDCRLASFPGVWKDGDIWYLVYECAGRDDTFPGDIGLAISTDGRHFSVEPRPILTHRLSGWEQANIGTPSLWKEGSAWYLFYHGFDGRACQIGLASGTDLHHLTRVSDGPILPVGGWAGWDSGTCGKRSIHKESPYYYMVYEGSTPQPYEQARWSSGLARSTDLIHWEKCPRNPILPQTPGGFGYDGPEWLKTPDGRVHVYFRGPTSLTQRATL